MSRDDEGLKSDELKAALQEALAGRPSRLEQQLAFSGAVLQPTPNFKLAAAFGAELATAPSGAALPLLARLAAEEAAPDDPRAFLPIAAAHGYAARLRTHRDVDVAWEALGLLVSDERAPVRLGALDALLVVAARDGGADALVARASGWLDEDDRELRYGKAAMVVEALGAKRVLAVVRAPDALFAYLSRVMAEAAAAPRAAERSDARRRLLAALPRALAGVIAGPSGGEAARRWLEAECAEATHPAVRAALSDAIVRLRTSSSGQGAGVTEPLRAALEGSAKPPRDPTRIRPGTGRGKASRRTR